MFVSIDVRATMETKQKNNKETINKNLKIV